MPSALEDATFVQNARDNGYEDQEIYDHLAKVNPAFGKMRQVGYEFGEVYKHIYESAQKQAVGLQVEATSPTSIVGATIKAANELTPPRPAPESMSPEALAWRNYLTGWSTEKPAHSPQAIHEFLKSEGLEGLTQATSPSGLAGTDPYATAFSAVDVGAYGERKKYEQEHPIENIWSQGARQPLLNLPKPEGPGVGAGIVRGAESVIEGLTTPENAILMASLEGAPAAIRTVANAAFKAMMIKGAAEHVSAAMEAKTPGEMAEHITGAVASGALVAIPEGRGEARRPAGLSQREIDRAIKTAPEPAANENIADDVLDGMVAAHDAAVNAYRRIPDSQNIPVMIGGIQWQLKNVPPERIAQARIRLEEQKIAATPIGEQPTSTGRATPPAAVGTARSPSAETTRLAQDAQPVAPETAKALTDTATIPKAGTPEFDMWLEDQVAATGRWPMTGDAASPDDIEAVKNAIAARKPSPAVEPAERTGGSAKPQAAGEPSPIAGPALISGGEPIVKGEIGQRHVDLIKEAMTDGNVDAVTGERGFHDAEGKPLTRTEAADRALDTKQIDQETYDKAMAREGEDKGLHSEDLIKGEKNAKEPVTTPSPVSTEQGKPVDTQTKGAAQEGDTRAQTQKVKKQDIINATKRITGAVGDAVRDVMLNGKTPEQAALDNGLLPSEAKSLPNTVQAIRTQLEAKAAKGIKTEPLGKSEAKDEPAPQGRQDEIDIIKQQEDPRGDYVGGPGAMGPVEAEAMRQTQTRTSTKNAIVDEERQKRGQEPIMSQARQSIGETWDAAMREIDRNPNAGRDLVDELNKKSRAVTAKEEAVLLHHKVDVMNDLENATRQALDPEATPEEQAEAHARAAKLMDDLNDIDSATRASGAEWGRMGRLRQMLAAEDYSLSRMLQKKQMGLGRELTAEETDRISKLNSRIEELEKKVTEHQENTEKVRQQAKDEALSEAIKRMKESQSPSEKYAQSLLDRIQSGLKSEADKARARIRERLGTTAAGVDPTVLYDAAVIGAEHLFKTGVDFAKWSAEMVKDIGEVIKPHLEAIFAQSQKINDSAVDKVAPASVRETIKSRPKTEEERRTNAVENIRRNADKPERIGSDIQKLAEGFVRSGITDRDELVAAVHNAVKDALPDATPRDIRDAISGYGDFKELNKDEVKTKLRDLKGQMQQVSKLEDMLQKGVLPEKTGIERRIPSAEERSLIKEVNRVKKELGLESTDPNRLKGALDAVKTRLRNRIEDLQRAIEKKEKIPSRGKKITDDAETIDLRKQKDGLEKEYKELIGTETAAIERAKEESLKNSIAELQRQIETGDVEPKTGKPTVDTEEVARLKSERDDLLKQKREMQKAKNPPRTEDERRLDALQKRAEELRDKISKGDTSTKTGKPTADTKEVADAKQTLLDLNKQMRELRKAERPAQTPEEIRERKLDKRISELEDKLLKGDISTKPEKATVPTESISKKQDRLTELNKQLSDLRKAANPKLSPDEIALKIYKTRVQNRINELNDRVSRGDFSKTPKKTVNLDAEGRRLKAEAERAKLSFDREVAKDRLSKRSWWEKAIDFGPKFGRAALLSNPVTLGKLTAAAAWRMVVTPIEEGIASGLKRLPFVDQIAARAPREGGGFNVRAESKALTQGFVKGMKDAYDLLTKGETELDVTGGKRQVEPHSWVDVFGKIHGALKTVTKRNEFERSFQQRIEHAMNNGVDVTDPAVQARIAVESYKDANRSIFQQDNRAVSAYNMAIRRLEQVDKATGKVPIGSRLAAATMKTLFPIVKIPTNIVAEAFQYATGTITGSARLAKAFHDGVRTLKPEEADLIMRELKKGSLGAGLMMLGYLAPQVIGGYYQRGEKRKEGETKAGDIKLYGTEIPSYLLHNPAVEQLQIGATIRRVADANEKKGGKKGIPTGVAAAAFGLTEEVPFVRETTEIGKAMDPNQRGKFFGELARSRIEPQVIQWVAQQMDKKTPFSPSEEPVKRDPKTMVEFMESGIPGLRKNVPEKKKKR